MDRWMDGWMDGWENSTFCRSENSILYLISSRPYPETSLERRVVFEEWAIFVEKGPCEEGKEGAFFFLLGVRVLLLVDADGTVKGAALALARVMGTQGQKKRIGRTREGGKGREGKG
jgi:hypothetical protein